MGSAHWRETEERWNDLSKEWMRRERVRKVLLNSQHLGGLIAIHRATYIALNAEGAIERWNRHVSIRKAKRYAVLEQEIVHQVMEVVIAKDDPAISSHIRAPDLPSSSSLTRVWLHPSFSGLSSARPDPTGGSFF
jgi:hypothetical protein